jgi:chemotaxis protein CheD
MLMRRGGTDRRQGAAGQRTAASDAAPPRPDLYLHAGQIVASCNPKVVMTILGSCVSICLWCAASECGGINHFVLPGSARGASSDRFGDTANRSLLRKLESLGCKRRYLQAKVFGGARVLGEPDLAKPSTDLGRSNIELALSFLKREGVPVVAQDVGGHYGRKLIFRTYDGAAWVKRIERLSDGDG